ncbi:MAG: thiamine pyrophosphate-binding protein [Chloroflexi bacterium]|nr:thiamine pyrophosphate-binding protein [Chloroflexota bacterium]
MLVITDATVSTLVQHAPYQTGGGEYGGYDLRGILRSMSKYTTVATNPKETVQGVQLAVKHATTGRRGPACVILNDPNALGVLDPAAPPFIYPSQGFLHPARTLAPDDLVQQALDTLAAAQRPVIIAGNGIHAARAYAELAELADLLGIPVATSYKGKSAFVETHPLALGMLGIYGQPAANRAVQEADVLLVAGCHLGAAETLNETPDLIDPARQTIIHLDIEPRNAGWVFPVAQTLIGDARTLLGQLVGAARGRGLTAPAGRREWVAAVKAEAGFFKPPEAASDAVPILPQRLVRTLNQAVTPDTILTLDAGSNRIWMAHLFQTLQPGTIWCPGGIAGMSWSAGAVLGAKLAHPERPCVAVTGDGGFAMSLHALSTALQYRLPVTYVVMNDSQLGMVVAGQGEHRFASEFVDTDFAGIARAFGCRGVTVQDAAGLAAAVAEARGADLPTVIDVRMDPRERYTKVVSPLAQQRRSY